MTFINALAGIAVGDLDASLAWYGKLLGRAADRQPMENEAEFDFERGGTAQIFRDAGRAGKSSITLAVDDIDAEVARLRDIGIEVGEPDRSDYADTLILNDPDGNQIVLAQAKSPDNQGAA